MSIWCLFHNRLTVLTCFDPSILLVLLQIFYLIGFGLFCLEALLSLWVIQVRDN